MTSPLLAVMRGLQQAINQVFPSLCRWVVNEGLDGLGRRRQAGEIVGDPSNQRRPGRCLRNRQALLPQALSDEGINNMAWHLTLPLRRPGRRHRLPHGLEGPM